MKKTTKFKLFALFSLSIHLIISCSSSSIHQGRLPFSLLEKPPSKKHINKHTNTQLHQFKEIATFQHLAPSSESLKKTKKQLQPGDIIAFFMSHKEASKNIKSKGIQKAPYELFTYGHLAMVIKAPHSGELKLLQMAMKQAPNIDSDLSYLDDKNWTIFRAPTDSLNHHKLGIFTQQVTGDKQSNPISYDYSGVLGLKNKPHHPTTLKEIESEYTCCTLIIAALNFSGYKLHTSKHKKSYDIITPKQVVASYGQVLTQPIP